LALSAAYRNRRAHPRRGTLDGAQPYLYDGNASGGSGRSQAEHCALEEVRGGADRSSSARRQDPSRIVQGRDSDDVIAIALIPVPVGDPEPCREAPMLLLEKFGIYIQPITYPMSERRCRSIHPLIISSPVIQMPSATRRSAAGNCSTQRHAATNAIHRQRRSVTSRPSPTTFFHDIGIGILRHNVVALAPQADELIRAGRAEVIDRAAIESDFSALGRFLITKKEADIAAFKTPDIRNVLVTGPYFHDGSQQTLWDIVDQHNKGDGLQNPYLDEDIQPLALTESEIDDLVEFMASLTSAQYQK
jgi:hypothetical protein